MSKAKRKISRLLWFTLLIFVLILPSVVYAQTPLSDKDKDTVPDKDDLCPEVVGRVEFKGCPTQPPPTTTTTTNTSNTTTPATTQTNPPAVNNPPANTQTNPPAVNNPPANTQTNPPAATTDTVTTDTTVLTEAAAPVEEEVTEPVTLVIVPNTEVDTSPADTQPETSDTPSDTTTTAPTEATQAESAPVDPNAAVDATQPEAPADNTVTDSTVTTPVDTPPADNTAPAQLSDVPTDAEITNDEAQVMLDAAVENDIDIVVEVNGEEVPLDELSTEQMGEVFTNSDPYFAINGTFFGYTSGASCPPIVLPANCTSGLAAGTALQAAIDALVGRGATAGNAYTITVEPGDYNGVAITNVNVPNFSLIVNGAQAGILGSSRPAPTNVTESMVTGAVTISVPNITLNGFTFQNAAGTAVALTAAANGVSILNNIIQNSQLGINVGGADTVAITGNSFRDNNTNGDVSVPTGSNGVNISNNDFASGTNAAVDATGSSNVTIANNQIDRTNPTTDTIALDDVSNANVSGNTVTFAGAAGTGDAIDVTSTTTTTGTTTISGNTLDGNNATTGDGIALHETGSSPVTINITGNDVSGFDDGVSADGVSNNVGTLTGNNLGQNNGFGVDNQTNQPLNASGNWWGCATGPGTAGCTSANGTALGPVTTSGFLTSPAPVTTATTTTPTTPTSGGGTTTTPTSNEPPRLTNNPFFVVFRQPNFDLDIYLVDTQSRGNFFAHIGAADLARFIQSHPGTSEAFPATFGTFSDAFGNAVRLVYLGNNRWRAEFIRGGALVQQDYFQTDAILGFATINSFVPIGSSQFLNVSVPVSTTRRTNRVTTTIPTTTTVTTPTQVDSLNLTRTLSIAELPFEFLYPADWVFNFKQRNITLASNQSDLAAEMDGDAATKPVDSTITLTALPLELLGLSPDASFTEVENYVLNLGVVDVEQILEVPVMMRRSVSFTGQHADGRHGITTLWLQNGSLIMMNLNTPNSQATNSLVYSWGLILGSVKPSGALPLAAPTDVPTAGIRFSFPVGWEVTQVTEPFTVTDKQSNSNFFTFASPVTDFVSNPNANLENVTDSVIQSLNINDVTLREEMVIFNAPALAFTGQNADGVWVRGLVTVGDGQAFLFIQTAPSQEILTSLDSTWIAVLQSIQLLAAL